MASLYDMVNGAVPRTQDQMNWKANADRQTMNLNSLPFVLDPSRITGDQAANKQLMYPSLMQTGGVQQIFAGGKNITPQMTAAGVNTDKMSPSTTLDDMAQQFAKMTGKSLDEAKSIITAALAATSGAPTAPNAASIESLATPYVRGPSDY